MGQVHQTAKLNKIFEEYKCVYHTVLRPLKIREFKKVQQHKRIVDHPDKVTGYQQQKKGTEAFVDAMYIFANPVVLGLPLGQPTAPKIRLRMYSLIIFIVMPFDLLAKNIKHRISNPTKGSEQVNEIEKRNTI